jgi:glycogen debranching enzyme
MAFQVNVDPAVLTINQGNTFMVTQQDGQISSEGEQGVFSNDTRFVSYYAIFADGQPWVRLNSATTAYYSSLVYLTNAEIETENGTIAPGTLALTLTRVASDGIHEDIDITNHGLHAVKFNLEIAIRSDFADIFEVKAHHFVRRGNIVTYANETEQKFSTSYTNRDFHRCFTYQIRNASSPPQSANGRINFVVELDPAATWHACGYYILKIDGDRDLSGQTPRKDRTPSAQCYQLPSDTETLQQQWYSQATQITTAQEEIYRLYQRSIEDMSALRLYDHDLAPDVWIPAAGVPWFVSIFGRDSLIVSLQNMIVHPKFALGALKKLGDLQATTIDDWRDAQPGKILHELRTGELAHFNRIPHTPYYGTADATPLYLIVLHETWKWTGDLTLLHDYRDIALRCLDWIDHYGDLDGDGFQEYQSRSSQGIENQGWKDSGDAVVYPDGSLVKAPKALCELQGYVFDAWMRMAEVFSAIGEPDRAVELQRKAKDLQTRFEQAFWCEDLGYYAFALDPDKQPVRSIASNPGHCLWSGMISPERAELVIRRLMDPELWSGWGIRTLSSKHSSFNPNSYHCGSVWAHDNGIIALGCKRYGFSTEAAHIARGISGAASHFQNYRMPEAYAGIQAQKNAFPVQYIQANVPQAWALGSVFHLLQAILGLQADAPNHRLYVDPDLPEWLPNITLHQLVIGNATVDLRFWREGGHTCWDAEVKQGSIKVEQKSWQPWLALK